MHPLQGTDAISPCDSGPFFLISRAPCFEHCWASQHWRPPNHQSIALGLPTSMTQRQANKNEPIVLVTSCDDNYVLGVAAAMRSAIASIPRRPIRLFVLDGGVSRGHRRKLHRSWASRRVSVEWLPPDLDAIADL